METSSNIVKLTDCTVELVEKLTWGMQEAIRAAMYGGLKVRGVTLDKQDVEFDAEAITRSKYKAIEVCVKKIVHTDGKESAYSKEWLNDLSVEDGDSLYAAVNVITQGKKK